MNLKQIKENLPKIELVKKQIREQNAALLKKLFKKV
jgi:hypothetical protein